MPRDLDQVPPLVIGREGVDAELAGERRDPLLGRADPLAADLDHLALADLLVEQPAADAVARLDHDRLRPGGERAGGRRRARQVRRRRSRHQLRARLGHRHGSGPQRFQPLEDLGQVGEVGAVVEDGVEVELAAPPRPSSSRNSVRVSQARWAFSWTTR